MKSFNKLVKNLKQDFSGFPTLRIAVLGESATQFLNQAIKALGYDHALNLEIFESDFDQVDQQILQSDSELYAFDPEFVIIYHSAKKLQKKFYKNDPGTRSQFASEQMDHVGDLYSILTKRTSAQVVYCNFSSTSDGVFGNFSNKLESSFDFQMRKINYELMLMASDQKDLFICDLNSLQAYFGNKQMFDPKLYINASLELSLDIIPHVASRLLDIIQSVRGKINKCVILDLDNTIWGGIIGDDGIERIEIGNMGVGKAYSDLQTWFKQLKERGIILAVCSKNNEDVAKDPFVNHPEMVLGLEDIAVFVANWENKADNIRYIQSVLNIGFDSMVFIDDNPYERNLVRESIAEITIPELPEDPSEYLGYLQNLNLFETASYSENDTLRTQQYQEESKRKIASGSFTDPEDFLRNLDMKANTQEFNSFTIPRVAQLTQRSNQFNLRTIRYSEEAISKIAGSDHHFGFVFSLEDKYGDNGIISIVVLEARENELFIDTWIMSCRVLKRGMEHFVSNYIINFALKNGHKRIVGEFLQSPKNSLVQDHYKNLGYKKEGDIWTLVPDNSHIKPTFIDPQ